MSLHGSWQQVSVARVNLLPVFVLLIGSICFPQPAETLSNVSLRGTAVAIVSLSAGSAEGSGHFAALKQNAGTGASLQSSASDSPDPTATIDFGDLSRGDGTPVVASVSLRVRSNIRFKITMSRTAFEATNLHYQGRDISGFGDGGSFLKVTGGPSAMAAGPDADASTCSFSSLLNAGVSLADVPSASTAETTFVVARGGRVSLRGGLRGANGVDLPFQFQCPTGTVIGPVTGGTGRFKALVRFDILPDA